MGAAVAAAAVVAGCGVPGATAAATAPTTIGAQWRSFRADITGIRPGSDDHSLFVQVALPGKDPGCVREPRIEQVVEAKTDIRADVVYSTRPAAGGCQDKVAAEVRLTTRDPIADRTVILNADTGNAWHKLGAGWGHCDRQGSCAAPADHCDPAWIGAAVSAAGAVSPGTIRACVPGWLILDLLQHQSEPPSRTAFRWSDAGWTSFAQARSAGCAEILVVEPKFPAALCRTLPAPA
ncbi:hypothetical protein AMES_0806 [Amycolatopsis mediterranei S699]|uniref:Integral membrane protein n=2 Tax=Amycolatopsis mediterranei TaxID=33910 RepID=A0A0H3CXG1_AMYMU|nr:hypothetical protein AMED_0809 [Amycolatopsis mediterranei U32]AEK39319.1 hypothetical protein RAM_04135 [Amycolatopsis mediterranei S699]AGT81471.1 hypothetical protein B737_0807 [Amycolatopsis mediterranei RB]KDO10071.1 hypothetical protein DV26_15440 [Amycolatopsis mediterranei]AFO74342.1 hypothetical protein AMES_0806 [Amycolatopsis mediterranei S699]